MEKFYKIFNKKYFFFIYRYIRNKKFRKKFKNCDKKFKDLKKDAKTYWSKYTKLYKVNYCCFYSTINGKFDVRYIPDDIYYTNIDYHFNNNNMYYGIDDKCYYDLLLPNVLQPKAYVRCINGFYYDNAYNLITINDAINLINVNNNIIFKPSIGSSGGKNIVFLENGINDEFINTFKSCKNFIIQEVVKQHNNLSIIHSSSINTIRVVSLLFENNVYILSSVLRMGINGKRVDNASSGGIVCGIDEFGKLKEYAFTSKGERLNIHPQGFRFIGHEIPSFNHVIQIVKKEAKRFAHFRLIHWDFAINEEGNPVFIEFNLQYGQLDFHQYANGPLFGDLTEKVLKEVFKKYK